MKSFTDWARSHDDIDKFFRVVFSSYTALTLNAPNCSENFLVPITQEQRSGLRSGRNRMRKSMKSLGP